MIARLTLICASLSIIVLMLPGQSSAAVDLEACMGAWLFDDDGGDVVEDISGNENHGVLKGGLKVIEGKFGQALDCDGVDDYADCGDNDTLDVGIENFTVLAWMKCAKYDPGNWEAQILYKFDHAAPRHGYLLAVRGSLDAASMGKPFFILGLGQDSGHHLFGTSPINDDVWHHLAVSVDRSASMILYRDGEIESQENIAASADQNEDTSIAFNIGSQSDSLARSIMALIDEVAVFRGALSQDDVKLIMNNGLEKVLGGAAVSPAGKLAACWGELKKR